MMFAYRHHDSIVLESGVFGCADVSFRGLLQQACLEKDQRSIGSVGRKGKVNSIPPISR